MYAPGTDPRLRCSPQGSGGTAPPPVAFVPYDPATGTYLAPDGRSYTDAAPSSTVRRRDMAAHADTAERLGRARHRVPRCPWPDRGGARRRGGAGVPSPAGRALRPAIPCRPGAARTVRAGGTPGGGEPDLDQPRAEADADMQRILDSATGTFRDDFEARSGPFVEIASGMSRHPVAPSPRPASSPRPMTRARVLVAVSVRPLPALYPNKIHVAGAGASASRRLADDVKVSKLEFMRRATDAAAELSIQRKSMSWRPSRPEGRRRILNRGTRPESQSKGPIRRRSISWTRVLALRCAACRGVDPGVGSGLPEMAGWGRASDPGGRGRVRPCREREHRGDPVLIDPTPSTPRCLRRWTGSPGEFRDQYTQLIDDVVIPGAKQQVISAVASVPAAASVSASSRHAVVLVLVDQTTTIGTGPPTKSTSSVRVTLDKVENRWLISQFEPV